MKKLLFVLASALMLAGCTSVTQAKDGVNGKDGKDGKDGATPYIGMNGNWFINNEDTGVSAGQTKLNLEELNGKKYFNSTPYNNKYHLLFINCAKGYSYDVDAEEFAATQFKIIKWYEVKDGKLYYNQAEANCSVGGTKYGTVTWNFLSTDLDVYCFNGRYFTNLHEKFEVIIDGNMMLDSKFNRLVTVEYATTNSDLYKVYDATKDMVAYKNIIK